MPLQQNASETFVTKLAEKTFLRFWCFPNVYRNDAGNPKEICDLLVVHDNSIIIASVKHVQFPSECPLDVGWRRWFKRAVEKSAGQLFGAERYLRQHPQQIYIDNHCSRILPITLPPVEKWRVYRVLIALGIGDACRGALGGSGSLILSPSIKDAEHEKYQFQIGNVCSRRGYVHVFDDVSFNLVVRELDTIKDFTEYLDDRDALLNSGRVGRCDGEENLVAEYLKHRAGPGHKFGLPKVKQPIHLLDGCWQRICADPRFAARKQADEVSYLWDGLIDFLWECAFCRPANEPEGVTPEAEKIARYMAGERRFARRALSNSLLQLRKRAPSDRIMRRAVRSELHSPRCYVFLVMPRFGLSEEDYRNDRRARLHDYALAAAYQFRSTHRPIIGIAMEHPGSGLDSFDVALVDVPEWSADLIREVEALKAERGFFRSDIQVRHGKHEEYPNIRISCFSGAHSLKVPRNAACPCGSGRKYKNCCGTGH